MSEKLTFEELEQRIQELERAVSEHERAKDALKKSEGRFRVAADNLEGLLYIMDTDCVLF